MNNQPGNLTVARSHKHRQGHLKSPVLLKHITWLRDRFLVHWPAAADMQVIQSHQYWHNFILLSHVDTVRTGQVETIPVLVPSGT